MYKQNVCIFVGNQFLPHKIWTFFDSESMALMKWFTNSFTNSFSSLLYRVYFPMTTSPWRLSFDDLPMTTSLWRLSNSGIPFINRSNEFPWIPVNLDKCDKPFRDCSLPKTFRKYLWQLSHAKYKASIASILFRRESINLWGVAALQNSLAGAH